MDEGIINTNNLNKPNEITINKVNLMPKIFTDLPVWASTEDK